MTQTTLAVTGNVSLPVVAASSTLSFSFTTESDGLVAQTQALIQTLASRNEDEVIAIARNARTMERCGYVIRGACARELLSRVAPLQGGRGKKDTQGTGRKAVLTALAAQFGVEARTLADDERIYATFYAPAEDSIEANLARYKGLGRDHFRVALTFSDPSRAIQVAADKAQEGGCSVRDLRAARPAARAEARTHGLVFAPEEGTRVSNPLSPVSIAACPAPDTALSRWEEVLGEEAVEMLRTLVTKYNAANPTAMLDATGYVRRLIAQAVRDAGEGLLPDVALTTHNCSLFVDDCSTLELTAG